MQIYLKNGYIVTMGADETVTSFAELKEAVYRKNPYGANITCDCVGIITDGFPNCKGNFVTSVCRYSL